MNRHKQTLRRFCTILILFLLLPTVAGCNVPGGNNNIDLEATHQALPLQQTQLALGFQQTALAIDQTKAAMLVQPTQTATQPSLPTYTPYPTYTVPAVLPTDTQAPTVTLQPTTTLVPTRDVAAQIKSANILIFEDIRGYPDLSPLISQAVRGMGFSGGKIVQVGDALGDFMTQLNSPTPWDLIIVGSESRKNVRGEFWDIILDRVNQKTALIAEMWYLDEIVNGRIAPLMAKCGVEFQKNWMRPTSYDPQNYSLYWLDSEDELLKSPNIVNPLYTPNIYWPGDAGDIMKLGSGGDAKLIAGLNPRDNSNSGVLTTCIEGRMILQTFSTHDYRQAQMLPLWQNFITYTLTNHFKALEK